MASILFSIPGEKKQYKCPTDADAVSLGKFIEVMQIEREEMPESMRVIVEEKDREKKKQMMKDLDPVEYSHKHIPYMAKVISVMCELDLTKIIGNVEGYKGMDIASIETLFGNCSRSVSRFKIREDFESFEFKGVNYCLPNKFMEGSTVIEYMEASQFQAHYLKLKEGMWGALPFVIAVIARPEGEDYDQDNTLIRGEAFKGLDLNTAMNISFFLMRLSRRLKKDSMFYILAQTLGRLKQEYAI